MTTLVETCKGAIRQRRPCEFPGFDYSYCTDKTDWKEEYDKLEKEHALEIENLESTIESIQAKQQSYIELHQAGLKRLLNLLLKYGNHLQNCNLLNLRFSGRITKLPEEEICSCKWIRIKREINEGLQSNSLTEEEIDTLIAKYMTKG